MKRKTLWVVALVALLAIGIAGSAFANEIAATVRNRFACDTVPGVAVTVEGTVSNPGWNSFTLTATDGTEYLVKTGPAKFGRNVPELTLTGTVTVDGFTGTGTNNRAEVAQGVNILRAKTITQDGEVIYDLTQVTVGGFGRGNCGAECNGEGSANQTQARNGGRGGMFGQLGGKMMGRTR